MITKLDRKIHFISQPHSGIGKAYIASILNQFIEPKNNLKIFCIQKFDIDSWDTIFEKFTMQANQIFIIHVVSALYISFEQYLAETKLLQSLSESNSEIIYHNILTPGCNGEMSTETIKYISGKLKNRVGRTIIWENHNCGISLKQQTKGKYIRFAELPEFEELKDIVDTIIYLKPESYYFQRDLGTHIFSQKTFNQAIHDSNYNLIYRQRLYQIQKRTFEAIKYAIN